MLDGWSNTHSNWIKMPTGPSLNARIRLAAPLAGCEYIFIEKRQGTFSLWLTLSTFLSVTGTKMYVIMTRWKNAVLFFRARFPHLSARKCHRGEHLCNGSLAEAGHTGVLWEEI